MNKTQKTLIANDEDAKNEIKDLKGKIKEEKENAQKDINGYKDRIKVLEENRDFAKAEILKAAAQQTTGADADYTNTGENLPQLNGVNYSSAKGKKLAEYMRNHSVGFIGYCSRYVSNGIAATGLGNERAASAHMMDEKLRNNKNFKEITVTSKEQLKSLPAGCIIVYEAGAARYSSKHGHIEVTLGNGTACSDGITRNMRFAEGDKMHVFVPVE